MLNAAGKSALASAVAAVTLGYLLGPVPASADQPGIAWKPCPADDPVEKGALKGLECGTLAVPLDHARPHGEKITLALSRARHTAARFQGAVLLNRGGPGAHGRDLPRAFTAGLPRAVAAGYDWIGFDPRGVGASRPAIVCDEGYQNPGRPRADTVPRSPAAEAAWVRRAQRYAADCGRRYPRLLPHMGTADWARDMDAIRAALGQRKINFFGYSYGTYLGAVYATMYPGRVRRMVLDSVVRPSGVWYDDNLDQNVAFEKRIRVYFGWIAKHHKVYRLGKSGKAVAAAYARARGRLAAKPVNGRIGATELDDVFLADGYGDYSWAAHARALSAYVRTNDGRGLAKAWQPPGWLDQNNYAVYEAVQCRDAAWPRDWKTWHADNTLLYRRGYRFETWSNAWYNAPCAFWSVPGGPPPRVQGRPGLPGLLLVQATRDAATPYSGGVEMHRRFPSSRLLVQAGGGNHGVTLGGDACVDRTVAAYFGQGRLPADRPGPDATCQAGPPPPAKRLADPGARAGDRPVREPVSASGA
ncbi:alpha/beta hydrolase [Actinomadura macrotermitis]|uniref:Tripeptidyl aminopeptidase n=1 Tax=Actinomadura macrotermitis TaxID=2585200 RepID=A0A7K0BP19_9ACTN|nr:Tripeptidyl aminopeptidase [Actinomadura macrotermitis]